MDPEKPSPWVTSVPGKRQAQEPEPGMDRTVRYWLAQPMWVTGPALLAVVLLLGGALLYTGWPPREPSGWAILIAAAVIAVGLLVVALTGRLTLDVRGIVIKLLPVDRFVPYSQVSSVRVCVKGEGRSREVWVELTLVSGERMKLNGLDEESMCRGIWAAKAAWERSRDDSEKPVAESRGDGHGPYRGRPQG